MSSFACQSGFYSHHNCVTTPGATFSHPITLNIYNVAADGAVGSLIKSVTQTFAIPYRPSADSECTEGRYKDATNVCRNGIAITIKFNLSGVTVPDQVIYGIAFNTTSAGYDPIGATPCSVTEALCGYDSLNIGIGGVVPPSVGFNPDETDIYLNSQLAEIYCDSEAGGVGTFRRDRGCGTIYQPPVKFTAVAANVATNADQCKNGGWTALTRPDGSTFKNQGECVSFTKTGK